MESMAKPHLRLGLMTFGPDSEPDARITDLETFNKSLDYFQAQGYNEVDTDSMTVGGKQESWTAKTKWQRRGLSLATGVYPSHPGDHSRARLREACEDSLRHLETSSVDIYFLYGPDRSVPFAETFMEANELYTEGKFHRLGISNYTAFEVAEIVTLCHERGWVRPTIFEVMYNVITRSMETEVIPACRRYGMDIFVYNPLAGGLLSGKIKSTDLPSEGRFSDASWSGEIYRQRYFRDANFEALRLIERAADEHSLSLVEIALRWLVHHSAVNIDSNGTDALIFGMSRFSQLEANICDAEKGPLPKEVVEVLDQAWAVAKVTAPPYWHLKLKYTYDTEEVLFTRC